MSKTKQCKTCNGDGFYLSENELGYLGLRVTVECPDCKISNLEQCKAELDAVLVRHGGTLSFECFLCLRVGNKRVYLDGDNYYTGKTEVAE